MIKYLFFYFLGFYPLNHNEIYYIVHYNTNALYRIGGGGTKVILNTDGTKPIYVQIAEWLETEILSGNHKSDQKVYSQYQLAEMFNINPATAAKGLNILVEQNILYKKRGLGMFVSKEARKIIVTKRKNQTLKQLVMQIVIEAKHLNISEEELMHMIREANIEGREA
jgi:DNA-binding transcriptional regulator YhcF (GntR family)